MIIKKSIGITSYGVALPREAIAVTEIETAQGKTVGQAGPALGVGQKTVPGIDEDTITLATAAATQALDRWTEGVADQVKRADRIAQIQALFIGSESHPYAVKPSGSVVSQALGLNTNLATADLQFACKAGTQAVQIGVAYVAAEMMAAALAIGADTAQSRPGDVLEFTAGAGAAAYIIGREQLLAQIIATTSYTTDTPDFWRKPGQAYPQHAGRFTGEPAYFHHVTQATQLLLAETGLKPNQIDWCVFHTPNGKFPQAVAAQLGFTPAQLKPALAVQKIGNTYAAATPLALSAVLDQAIPNQKILVASYGSGAGADSFLLETTPLLIKKRKNWTNLLQDQINRLQLINYQQYRQRTGCSH